MWKTLFAGPAAGDDSLWVIALVCGCDPPGVEFAIMILDILQIFTKNSCTIEAE